MRDVYGTTELASGVIVATAAPIPWRSKMKMACEAQIATSSCAWNASRTAVIVEIRTWTPLLTSFDRDQRSWSGRSVH